MKRYWALSDQHGLVPQPGRYQPSKISVGADGTTKYLPLQKHYLRFPGKITYVFLLEIEE